MQIGSSLNLDGVCNLVLSCRDCNVGPMVSLLDCLTADSWIVCTLGMSSSSRATTHSERL